MKKIISLLLVIVLLCTGCAGGKSSDEGKAEVGTGKKEKNEIRVYILSISEWDYEMAQTFLIGKFEAMYPEYKVNLEVGVSGEDGITMPDAIRNLNVDMMAGNGPDVLFLDGLPVHEYIEKGMLEDMSGLLKELKNSGEVFFENVLTSYGQNGKICAVPTTFTVPVVVGDEAAVQAETIHDFAELAAQRANAPIPVFDEMWMTYLPEIFMSGWNDVFQDKEKVDREALKELLQDMKQMAEASGFDKDLPSSYRLKIHPVYENGGGNIEKLVWEQGQMSTMTFAGPRVWSLLNAAKKVKPISYEYLNRKNGNLFFPNLIIGMNAASENEKEAEIFIKHLLSAEFVQEVVGNHMYGSSWGYGLLVNKGNMEKEMDLTEDQNPINVYENFDYPEKEKLYAYELTPQEIQEVFTFLDKADTSIDIDYTLLQSMMDLVENYIFERETLESVVDEIVNKVELYQAE